MSLPAHPDQTAYRQLVVDCAHSAPDFRDYEIADLPDLDADDLALVQRVKDLTEVNTVEEAKQALLEDVIAECDHRNERRAMARDEEQFERYHGGDTPYNERESDESYYGMGRTFR